MRLSESSAKIGSALSLATAGYHAGGTLVCIVESLVLYSAEDLTSTYGFTLKGQYDASADASSYTRRIWVFMKSAASEPATITPTFSASTGTRDYRASLYSINVTVADLAALDIGLLSALATDNSNTRYNLPVYSIAEAGHVFMVGVQEGDAIELSPTQTNYPGAATEIYGGLTNVDGSNSVSWVELYAAVADPEADGELVDFGGIESASATYDSNDMRFVQFFVPDSGVSSGGTANPGLIIDCADASSGANVALAENDSVSITVINPATKAIVLAEATYSVDASGNIEIDNDAISISSSYAAICEGQGALAGKTAYVANLTGVDLDA